MARHDIDEALIARLAALLDEHALTELEYGEGRWRVRVSRREQAGRAAPAPAPAAAGAEAEAQVSPTEIAAAHPGAVTSPIVGTVYVAPEPGAAPFVKVGDAVKEGQTLLLVEAMKTMNPIRAPRDGKVFQIFATNATPVEYGEVLLIIE